MSKSINAVNLDIMRNDRCCPECKSSWDGGAILDTFIKQRDEGRSVWKGKSDSDILDYIKKSYGEPYRWGREIAVEVAGGYDGVSYWRCPDCKSYFDRFTGEKATIPSNV